MNNHSVVIHVGWVAQSMAGPSERIDAAIVGDTQAQIIALMGRPAAETMFFSDGRPLLMACDVRSSHAIAVSKPAAPP